MTNASTTAKGLLKGHNMESKAELEGQSCMALTLANQPEKILCDNPKRGCGCSLLQGCKQNKRLESTRSLSPSPLTCYDRPTSTGELTEQTAGDSSGSSKRSSAPSNNFNSSSTRGCMKIPSQRLSLARTYCKFSGGEKKSVSWGTIEINTHSVILGANPAVSLGPRR